MTKNADINSLFAQCSKTEREIEDLISTMEGAKTQEKQAFSAQIGEKIESAKQIVSTIESEISDPSCQSSSGQYTQSLGIHKQTLKQIEESFDMAGKSAESEEAKRQISIIFSNWADVSQLSDKSYIFRASIAYIRQQMSKFLAKFPEAVPPKMDSSYISSLQKLSDLLVSFKEVLVHLAPDTWIRAGLNFPPNYVHRFIVGFRTSIINISHHFGITPDMLELDKSQDRINKFADYQALKDLLLSLKQKVLASGNTDMLSRIEKQVLDISNRLKKDGSSVSSYQKPSCSAEPSVPLQTKAEALLSQFKSINVPKEDLLLIDHIGTGGFGRVALATRLSTAEKVAVKELREDRLSADTTLSSLYAEITTMLYIHHPFILELVGAHITEPFQIITRYCPGKSLHARLHGPERMTKPLSMDRRNIIAYQVAVGMAFLHSQGIVHRDLKPLNILLDDEDDSYIADFGLCKMMKDNQEMMGRAGTPNYNAPEVLNSGRYGPQVDSYSYGVVLWEMLTGCLPFCQKSHTQIFEHVVTSEQRLPIPNRNPEGIKKLISRCWSKNPNDRPGFDEIVKLFESGSVYFPNSSKIDFNIVKSKRKNIPIDLDYAEKVLKNPSSEHFSSVAFFICDHINDEIRGRLRRSLEGCLGTNSPNTGAVLLLASELLKEEELPSFIRSKGISMFAECVSKSPIQSKGVYAAVRFGLKIPNEFLQKVKIYLPDIVNFLKGNFGPPNDIIYQFLVKFTGAELHDHLNVIKASIIAACKSIDDQATFNAVVSLLQICQSSMSKAELREFYPMLCSSKTVPATLVDLLIQAKDADYYPKLIINVLKASLTSDIHECFVNFIQPCVDESVFSSLVSDPSFDQTVQSLLEGKDPRTPLTLIFCMSSHGTIAESLANSRLLGSLIQMKTNQSQRLQILTNLTIFEKFCSQTKCMDGIIRLIVSSLSDKDLLSSAIRLIGAISTHSFGCQLLSEKKIIDLFTQLFLSSPSGNSSNSLTIFRNMAGNRCEIPQISLVISCLMQDLFSGDSKRGEIMETLVSLIEIEPSSVLEHDLQRIIYQQWSDESPLFLLLSLKLFNVCDPSKLRNLSIQLLAYVHAILNDQRFLFPEIIEEAVKVVSILSKQFDISQLLDKFELKRYLAEVVALIPQENPHRKGITDLANQLFSSVV